MKVFKNYEDYSQARLGEQIQKGEIGSNDFPNFNAQKSLEAKQRWGFPSWY